jgi:hypothetical protein
MSKIIKNFVPWSPNEKGLVLSAFAARKENETDKDLFKKLMKQMDRTYNQISYMWYAHLRKDPYWRNNRNNAILDTVISKKPKSLYISEKIFNILRVSQYSKIVDILDEEQKNELLRSLLVD